MEHTYTIIVQDHLNTDWSEELEGMMTTHHGEVVRILSGRPHDVLTLCELLLKVRELLLKVRDPGLSLLS